MLLLLLLLLILMLLLRTGCIIHRHNRRGRRLVELSAKLVHMGYLQSANKYLKENGANLTEEQLKLHAWLKKKWGRAY